MVCGVSVNSKAGEPLTVVSVKLKLRLSATMAAFALLERVGVAKQHPHPVQRIVDQHVLIGHAGVAQRGAKVLLVVIEQLLDGALHVNLIHQVDAAPQVEAEFQRTESDVAHPFRNPRRLRQGDGEFVGTRFADDVACLQLILLAAEAQRQTSPDREIRRSARLPCP